MIKLIGTAFPGTINEQIDLLWLSASHIQNSLVTESVQTKARDGIYSVIRLTVQEGRYGSNHSDRYR